MCLKLNAFVVHGICYKYLVFHSISGFCSVRLCILIWTMSGLQTHSSCESCSLHSRDLFTHSSTTYLPLALCLTAGVPSSSNSGSVSVQAGADPDCRPLAVFRRQRPGEVRRHRHSNHVRRLQVRFGPLNEKMLIGSSSK